MASIRKRKDALANGPVPAKEVEARAEDERIAQRTLRRAKQDLEVQSVKRGLQDGWAWQLPNKEH